MKILITAVIAMSIASIGFVAPLHAATSPDSCFGFDGATITNYYANEGNNLANPACPRDVDIPATKGGNNVTGVSQYGMSSKGLTAPTLPSTLTNYGGYAFAHNQITELVVPEGIASIGTGVFRQNTLTQVTLPSTLTSIGDRAFVDNNLPSVDIPDGVTYYRATCFLGQPTDFDHDTEFCADNSQ